MIFVFIKKIDFVYQNKFQNYPEITNTKYLPPTNMLQNAQQKNQILEIRLFQLTFFF
jgi:hypothetical protein